MAMAAAVAATGGRPYGDSLLGWEIERHRQLVSARIELDSPGQPHFDVGASKARPSVVLPLSDALGNRIGTLTLQFAHSPKKQEAEKIAVEVARHVYSSSTLSEPDPFVAGAMRSIRGQSLVERELRREPDLVTIALHVALPGRDNRIIASNFGRIGKAADDDDKRVSSQSTNIQEQTNGGKRLAVELPLLERSGRTIGALSTSFMIGPGGRQAAYQSALRVQHDLSRSIPELGTLEQ